MKLKIPVKPEGKDLDSIKMNIQILNFQRYRQEAYLYKNQIFLFGGGGVSGISYSLQRVSLSKNSGFFFSLN
jgi:hypothetical protein